MESVNGPGARDAARRVLGAVFAAVIAAALVALHACDPAEERARDTDPAGADASVPDPGPRVEPAQQKLDAGLGPAYRSMKAGRWSAAREEVAAYLRDQGASARRGQAAFVIAMTYHRQQLYGESSAHFDRAIAAEPGFLESYYYGGSAHQNIGNLARARALLAVYARHNAADAATAFQQGLVELEDDRVDAAERFFESAIALAEKQKANARDPRAIDDDLGRYYARLGDVFVRRDDYPRAKAAFTKATELRSDIPDTWHKLKVACERTGDAAGAARAQKRFDEVSAARAKGLPPPR
jgi:tetratricopeptide (TPR) repeat protein